MMEMNDAWISSNETVERLRKKVRAFADTHFDSSADELLKQAMRSMGPHPETRWDSGSADFKPLRDVLGYSKDPFDQEMYKFLNDHEIQQFVISPELAYEVFKLNNSLIKNSDEFKQLLPKARPPYPRCCVEIPITDLISKEMLQPINDDEQEHVRRLGAYIETRQVPDETLMYIMYMYYEYKSGAVQTSIISYIHNDNRTIKRMWPLHIRNLDSLWNGGINPLLEKGFSKHGMNAKQVIDGVGGEDAFKLSLADTVHDIPVLFFSWLFLLNSKSGMVSKNVPMRRVPSAYGKKHKIERGRSAYTIVALDDMEYINNDNLVCNRELVTAHRVRGHFKQKPKGIYWWRPHVRGKGELIDREGYKVL
jgi:hypothetical protein